MPWTSIELAAAELGNADESALRGQTAAHENVYVSDARSLTRFPGMRRFMSTGGSTDIILASFRGDLIGVDRGGQVYRIRQDGTFANVTGVPMIGGGRPVFAETENELLIAAGVWGWAVHVTGEGFTPAITSGVVSLAAGALFANVVSVAMLIGETLMSRR